MDKEDDIHVKTGTVGSDPPRRMVRVRVSAVFRKVRTRGGSRAGMRPPTSNTRNIPKNAEFVKKWTKEKFSPAIAEFTADVGLNIETLNNAEPINFVKLFVTDDLLELIL